MPTGIIRLRAIMPEDDAAARAVVTASLRDTRYLHRALELLDAALAFDDPEFMGMLATNAEGEVETVAIFGTVAGADRVVKLHQVTGGSVEACISLIDAIGTVCRESGERLVACELPDDAPFATSARALEDLGYRIEGRVPDFNADGIDLRLYVWRNDAVQTSR